MRPIVVILSLFLFACSNNPNIAPDSHSMKNARVGEETAIGKNNTNVGCDFEKCLSDPNTSQLAKNLFNNSAQNDESALLFFDSLQSENFSTRAFYFKVLGNAYSVSDAAFSEGLGSQGYDYIENHTCEFLAFFDHHECFNKRDLQNWANIARLEISIESDPQTNDSFIATYLAKLKSNCSTCSSSQLQTLQQFEQFLKAK
jgi:hypothetical protein